LTNSTNSAAYSEFGASVAVVSMTFFAADTRNPDRDAVAVPGITHDRVEA
jgi:hypothetical protein